MDDPTHSYAMNALRRQKEAKKRKNSKGISWQFDADSFVKAF
jgi:hypothetical protein